MGRDGPFGAALDAADNRIQPSREPDCDTMLEQIEELLSAEAPTLARMEDTLTEGYAQALALEAERWRLERRIGEVAREAPRRHRRGARSLGTRLTRADGELTELRSLLGTLHERARDLARRSSLDDSGANGVDSRLDAVVDLQLHQDVRDVVLDRLRADVELGRR